MNKYITHSSFPFEYILTNCTEYIINDNSLIKFYSKYFPSVLPGRTYKLSSRKSAGLNALNLLKYKNYIKFYLYFDPKGLVMCNCLVQTLLFYFM